MENSLEHWRLPRQQTRPVGRIILLSFASDVLELREWDEVT